MKSLSSQFFTFAWLFGKAYSLISRNIMQESNIYKDKIFTGTAKGTRNAFLDPGGIE